MRPGSLIAALLSVLALTSCGSSEEPTNHYKLSGVAFFGVKAGDPALVIGFPADTANMGAVPVQIRIAGNRPFVTMLYPNWNSMPDEQLATILNGNYKAVPVINYPYCCLHGAASVLVKEPGAPGFPAEPGPVSDATFAAARAWLSARATITYEYPDHQFDVQMAATPQLIHDIRAQPTVWSLEPAGDPLFGLLRGVVFTDAAHGVHASPGDTVTLVYTEPDGSTLTRTSILE